MIKTPKWEMNIWLYSDPNITVWTKRTFLFAPGDQGSNHDININFSHSNIQWNFRNWVDFITNDSQEVNNGYCPAEVTQNLLPYESLLCMLSWKLITAEYLILTSAIFHIYLQISQQLLTACSHRGDRGKLVMKM